MIGHALGEAAMDWKQRGIAKAAALIAYTLAFIPLGASAKDTQFWNLTANTITSLQLSPPGKNEWGRNQADNDRDHTVDHDERLRITGVEPGRYDARVRYRDKRQCVVRDIELKADAVFSIADKDLTDCHK